MASQFDKDARYEKIRKSAIKMQRAKDIAEKLESAELDVDELWSTDVVHSRNMPEFTNQSFMCSLYQ